MRHEWTAGALGAGGPDAVGIDLVLAFSAHTGLRLHDRLSVLEDVSDEGDVAFLMRIATFNINNINKRIENLTAWLLETSPDVVCLQELKCTDDRFPFDAIRDVGYQAVWRVERSWSGVAILARGKKPVLNRDAPLRDTKDRQSR